MTTAPVDVDTARRDYAALVERGLSLDITRGKPSPRQLDLSADLLTLPDGEYKAEDGTDTRNYGGLKGLPELRRIFADALQVPVEQLLAAGNSSLELMHDAVVQALLSTLPGGERRWADEPRVAMLCPVPGYDRHFALAERFGIELIQVPMTGEGPDMDVVERLAAEDAGIKGIWCVPKYSNPTGVTFSDEVARRLASMTTAAPDFRIFWDNAYAVHHLTDTEAAVADILALCAEAGNPDRAFVFGSTSKITLAGSGVGFFGSSEANIAWWTGLLAKRTIGPDKVNQLRHAMFLKDADGVRAHMRKHAEIIAPKFAAVDRILTEELGDSGLATWTKPTGGYFVSLTVPEGTAKEVVRLAKEAGVALTPAGATHPHGDDPQDATIRIAPTFPELAEVEEAVRALAVCVRLAVAERA
ncbi:aminotransferase class I/II-fold pyridoxal phosphate-dependent enzyme [Amycolatopsis sp. FDAARGOS 1241]|uniref:aminotransferase class I/II-fold pyridoxal phosphate-dependent enzyme n=1 Tax=Amycolatopsis sp. FDAARGOS 1241 TaxID=2778070 RepID=UPI00194EE60B|nr:aminotransferase class I/II-fold pyridoxal phosphate-dependent enzyme [Amycolatopsis sp. FDAARGOS 1241]QRP44057.1 aminotransferase class I/II-fold pyridoxal phosphate-dependent enzyme [Amycolatopsis sp. FDAARGOS 1241]